MMLDYKNNLGVISSNILLLIFALYFNWNVWTIIFIFFCESIIIGIFTILKMLFSKSVDCSNNLVLKIFFSLFFIIHYGLFHLVYFMFMFYSPLYPGTAEQIISDWPNIVFILATYILSMAVDFKNNLKDLDGNAAELIFEPYHRIIPMHLTIILGGFIALSFAQSIAHKLILVLFIALATAVEILRKIKI